MVTSKEDRIATLEIMAAGQETRISLLSTIAERQLSLIEEVRRDSRHFRRMLVIIAKKANWLDDKDLKEFEDGDPRS